MTYQEFENFRKAPHPFEQYGNLPPAALKNRSVPKDYGSLPQGDDAFRQLRGKKQYNQRNKVTQMQKNLFQNDSLTEEVERRKVYGRSLETYDIEGAQGGSMKPLAVKYKQKAQQLKSNDIEKKYDGLQFQQSQYKRDIYNAIKNHHENEVMLRKYISQKGNGHIAKYSKPSYSSKYISNIPQDDAINTNHLPYQKIRSIDSSKHSDHYKYSNRIEKNDKYLKKNNPEQFNENLSRKYNSQKNTNFSLFGNPEQRQPQLHSTIQYELSPMTPNHVPQGYHQSYQSRNHAKTSLQSQFKTEIIGPNSDSKGYGSASRVSNSQLNKNPQDYLKKISQISGSIRRQNPTHLSTAINSSKLIG